MFANIFLPLLPLLALFALPASAGDAASLRQRRVYQVITDRFATTSTPGTCNVADALYCGGTYKGLTSKLDYIKGMGFDTVWISPIVSNIGGRTGHGEAYHGYWTLDASKTNDKFGSADDLKALSAALHAKGMYLMVDIVVNHVAATSAGDFQPNSAYGAFSTSASYHPFCWITDYTNQTQVENCWLGDSDVALPDLNTENAAVASYWNDWVKNLISTYSVDYIRLDTVKHVPKAFWKNFLAAANVGNVGEILDGSATYVGAYQKEAGVNAFNYPIYYPLTRAFNGTGNNVTELINMVGSVKSSFSDPTLLGGFLNNHDNPRFESWVQDQALIKNAHAYALVTDGTPYVYQGSEAGFKGGADPLNREPLWTSNYNTGSDMYKFFASLNNARSAAGNATAGFHTTQMTVSALSNNDLLISKAPLVSILTNRGSSAASSNLTIAQSSSGWGNNVAVIDALTCTQFTTGSNGALAVSVEGGNPRVLIETSKKGALCPSVAASTGKGAAGRISGSWVAPIAAAGLAVLGGIVSL